jgi:hypothetical protein
MGHGTLQEKCMARPKAGGWTEAGEKLARRGWIEAG